MTKEQLVEILGDMNNEALADKVYDETRGLTDSEVDAWLHDHYNELKDDPVIGEAAFKASKDPSADESELAAHFGLTGEKAVDKLFNYNSDRNWATIPMWKKEEVAEKLGVTWPDLKKRLVDAGKNYNEALRKKDVAKMVDNEMNVEFTEHPIDWLGMAVANAFIPNIVESAKEDAIAGKGATTYAGFAKEHPADVLTDALLSGLSFVPAGGYVAGKLGAGSVGKIIGEGAHQVLNEAANEGSQAILHDKEFDPQALALAAALGGGGEALVKGTAGKFAGLFKDSDKMRKFAKELEESGIDRKEFAEDYMARQRAKIKQFENPETNPWSDSFKRSKATKDNVPVTPEDYAAAKEAEELFAAINEKRKPTKEGKDFLDFRDTDEYGMPTKKKSVREMTDQETQEAFLRNKPLNDIAFLEPEKLLNFNIADNIIAGGLAGEKYGLRSSYNAPTDGDKKRKAKKALKNKSADWAEGVNIPRSASDPDWAEFQQWAEINPEQYQQAKIKALGI